MSQRPAMRAAEAVIADLNARFEERDAEIARLRVELEDEHTYHRACSESWERAERLLVERNREIEALRATALPRTDNRGYDLRQRFNRAVRWLRDAEDIARSEMPGWPTADRIRDIHEQITDDLLNGRTSVPPLKQRLAEAENALRILGDPENWQGDPHDQAATLYGHFTPFELARKALGTDDG